MKEMIVRSMSIDSCYTCKKILQNYFITEKKVVLTKVCDKCKSPIVQNKERSFCCIECFLAAPEIDAEIDGKEKNENEKN